MSKKLTAKETQTTLKKRVALYLRISADPENNEVKVKRQEKESRAFISRQWPGAVVVLYVDNDTTANTDYGKVRPRYEAMMQDARDGKVDVIVSWSAERLTRSPRECEDVLDLHDKMGVGLATMGGEVDLATPFGRMALRIFIVFARAELEQRQYRQHAQTRELAAAGKVHKGGRRPFGYEDDKLTIRETEAAVIREAADRVLSGHSLNSVVESFSKRKIVGPNGGALTSRGLRAILVSARISGRREHFQSKSGAKRPVSGKVDIVCDAAEWDGIISHEDSDRLRELLTDARLPNGIGNARKHLLPGFLECSECGMPMQSHQQNGKPGYVCRATPGQKCKRSVVAASADAVVTGKLLRLLEKSETRKLLQKRVGVDKAVVAALHEDQKQLDQAAEDEANGLITRSEWLRKRAVIQARIDEAELHIKSRLKSDALSSLLTGEGTIEQRWEKLGLAAKREVLNMMVKRIVITPPSKMGSKFDEERVQVQWAA